MKKKFITLLLCAAVGIGALSGCGGNTPAKELPEDSVAADITVDKESLPPLSEDLQEIYEGAYKIYYQISFGAFDYDENATYEKDELTYYKITDPRFPTYEDFRTYLLQYFTEFFVDNSILSKDNLMFTKGKDGGLYYLGGGRGSNIFYAGHTFEIDKESEDEIGFEATAYYTNSNEAYKGDYFYTTPDNPEDYTTQKFLFVLWKEDAGWRFNTFHLFF